MEQISLVGLADRFQYSMYRCFDQVGKEENLYQGDLFERPYFPEKLSVNAMPGFNKTGDLGITISNSSGKLFGFLKRCNDRSNVASLLMFLEYNSLIIIPHLVHESKDHHLI